ncbi:MAG: glutathione synthase [Arenicella sp.]|jgi:glutathione synthase
MKLLFITDHRHHRYFDSVYLLTKWASTIKGLEVYVASIGTAQNTLKLSSNNFQSLHTVRPSTNTVFENKDSCFTEGSLEISNHEFDWVCLRVLPICESTLEKIGRSFTQADFINGVESILRTESKEFLLNTPNLCPPMLLCHCADDVMQFLHQSPAVLKPLYGYGGKTNILINNEICFEGSNAFRRKELEAVLNERFSSGQTYLAMQYLPQYVNGDKRILVINGKVVGASLRIPQDSWLCNVSSGGKVNSTELNAEEYDAVNQLAPLLKAEGISMFGIDTLESDNGKRLITEINTCCPGGFYSINTVLKKTNIEPETIKAFQQILSAA